jgi:23S rRNA (guanosine2251-2'-O)-methyltransferase
MEIIVIAHNIRSTHNVGSILRTSDGFGIAKVFFTGYTPYPTQPDDTRLPHERDKLTRQIHKTALGAETTVPNEYAQDPVPVIESFKKQNYTIAALEQDDRAVMLPTYKAPGSLVLLLGEEVHGIEPYLRELCDTILEIPMRGQKESFNVSVATGIALYELSKNM